MAIAMVVTDTDAISAGVSIDGDMAMAVGTVTATVIGIVIGMDAGASLRQHRTCIPVLLCR
jgi:hypothetical protein